MKKLSLILLLAGLSLSLHAQHFKLAITEGIGLDPNKKQDSLFLAKNYYVTQLKLGYHYGKLGVILNTNYILQHTDHGDFNPQNLDKRIPEFARSIDHRSSDVHTFNAALGLELCVPIIKHKAQINVYAAYGISLSKSDSVLFFKSIDSFYKHKAVWKMSGCVAGGISLNYKLNAHMALKWQNEFNAYKIPFEGVDTRKSFNTYAGKQRKLIFISSLGIQYTF